MSMKMVGSGSSHLDQDSSVPVRGLVFSMIYMNPDRCLALTFINFEQLETV